MLALAAPPWLVITGAVSLMPVSVMLRLWVSLPPTPSNTPTTTS